MTFLLNLVYVILGVAGLYYGAEFLVRGGAAVAKKAGVSPLVIGLTLVAFATSAPELVVSVSAAFSGNPDISIGNIVGSNICNIALILGLSACIHPLAIHKDLMKLDAPLMLFSAVLLAVFLFVSHGITRVQGIVFFLIFAVYTGYILYASRKNNAQSEDEPEKSIPLWKAVLLVFLGFVFLVAGAKIFLTGVVWFAVLLKLSDAVIGLTVVAVGTSLPELATSVVAAVKGENDIAVGNVIGSNIFNILAILGITGIVHPLSGSMLSNADLGVMLALSVLLLPFMRTGWKISRKEGAVFLLIYAAYLVFLFKP